jgi:anaerobic nitric oxide reductase flavorubredoxin
VKIRVNLWLFQTNYNIYKERDMHIKVVDNVYWVGKVDWELRKFHGDEYSTHRGSTYNSYLVREVKTALIDTVWAPYAGEFVENLAAEIDLATIDYIIANHAEIDHSGALPELMRHIPDTPIYCSKNGVKSLKGHYHQDWNFNVVKTGDRLSLGDKELIFVELFNECLKYYANILTPFSPLVTRKIKEVLSLNLPLDVICTSHGIIWRDKPAQIVEKYLQWADNYQENQITIVYDTMWQGTRVMAEKIAEGIGNADQEVNVKLFSLAKTDKNDVITEIFKSKAILVGSPTINRGILVSVAGILEEIKGLQFKNKKAAAFGSYGWSGESTKIISENLASAGFELLDEGLKALWNPDAETKAKCVEYGGQIAGKLSI